jgi:hypothetical protein
MTNTLAYLSEASAMKKTFETFIPGKTAAIKLSKTMVTADNILYLLSQNYIKSLPLPPNPHFALSHCN